MEALMDLVTEPNNAIFTTILLAHNSLSHLTGSTNVHVESPYLSDLHERLVHVCSSVAILQVCLRQFVLLDELSVEIPEQEKNEGVVVGKGGVAVVTAL